MTQKSMWFRKYRMSTKIFFGEFKKVIKMEQLQNFAKARSSSFITPSSNKDDLPPPGSFLDSGENSKEGWLHILSKKKWERRYFILKKGSSMLNFYKSPKVNFLSFIIYLFFYLFLLITIGKLNNVFYNIC